VAELVATLIGVGILSILILATTAIIATVRDIKLEKRRASHARKKSTFHINQ
jgi:hypothetical protein